MTTAVIVQARVSSTRLPGKVLEKIGRQTVIEQVLERCRHITGADIVVCAIPESSVDDGLAQLVESTGIFVVRGSESDVLDRYIKAAAAVGASVILRITADCPLLDPQICAGVLRLRERDNVDYASNVLQLSFPKGLDCEAFTAVALNQAGVEAKRDYDREHVTPFLIRAPNIRRANLFSGDASLAKLRWTLDYPEDLAFVRAVLARLPDHVYGMSDVLEIIEREPSLIDINAARNSYLQDLNAVAVSSAVTACSRKTAFAD